MGVDTDPVRAPFISVVRQNLSSIIPNDARDRCVEPFTIAFWRTVMRKNITCPLSIVACAIVGFSTTLTSPSYGEEETSKQTPSATAIWNAVSLQITADDIASAEKSDVSKATIPSLHVWWGSPVGSFTVNGDTGEAFYVFKDRSSVQFKEHYALHLDEFRNVDGRPYAFFHEKSLDGSVDYPDYKWAFPCFLYPSNVGIPAFHSRPGESWYRHSFVSFTSLPTIFPLSSPSR